MTPEPLDLEPIKARLNTPWYQDLYGRRLCTTPLEQDAADLIAEVERLRADNAIKDFAVEGAIRAKERAEAQLPKPECQTCQGRGWIMKHISYEGFGGAGGSWNETCPDCRNPQNLERK